MIAHFLIGYLIAQSPAHPPPSEEATVAADEAAQTVKAGGKAGGNAGSDAPIKIEEFEKIDDETYVRFSDAGLIPARDGLDYRSGKSLGPGWWVSRVKMDSLGDQHTQAAFLIGQCSIDKNVTESKLKECEAGNLISEPPKSSVTLFLVGFGLGIVGGVVATVATLNWINKARGSLP